MFSKMRNSQKLTVIWMISILLLLLLSSLRFLWSNPSNGQYVELCTSEGSRVVWVDGKNDSTLTFFANTPEVQTPVQNQHHNENPFGHCPFCLIGLFGITLLPSLWFMKRVPFTVVYNCCSPFVSIPKLFQAPYQSRAPPAILFV